MSIYSIARLLGYRLAVCAIIARSRNWYGGATRLVSTDVVYVPWRLLGLQRRRMFSVFGAMVSLARDRVVVGPRSLIIRAVDRAYGVG